jgi:transposase
MYRFCSVIKSANGCFARCINQQAVQADEDVVGTSRVRELERRMRELERLLGRKTMEVEILKEALDVARVKKPSLQLPSWNDRKDGSP